MPGLWKVEALLWRYYLVRLPSLDIWLQARWVRRPLQDLRFGETPYFTGLAILEEVGAGPQDRFVDLGCGRGKMTFLAALARGCSSTGVELLAGYTWAAEAIRRALGLQDRVRFLREDLLETDLSQGTIYYVTAPTWAEETRRELLERIDELPDGARWVSVGWACRHPRLELVRARRLLFSWGREIAWFYRVLPSARMRPSPSSR